MKYLIILCTTLPLLIICTTLPVEAKRYMSNDYEVEVLWKVKGKNLRIWGDIEKGRTCKRLKVYVRLYNSRYHKYAYLKSLLKREHQATSRSVFKGQYKIGTNKAKKGWDVEKIDITCSGLNPL